MTYEEAAAVLGPELMGRVEEQVAQHPPLTPEQIAFLVPLLLSSER